MSTSELNLFSYMVMALVGRGGASPYELQRMARQGRIYDWAGESQYYVEPKRLAKLGYLEARKEPGQTRPRTVYTLTDKGRDALRAWARTPARLSPVRSEPLIRLLVADLAGDAVTRESMAALREDIADVLARLDESAAAAETLPHRRRNLLLVNGFLRRLMALYEDLVDDVESELAPRRAGRAATPARRRRG